MADGLLVDVRNLSVRYSSGYALRDVSARFKKGRITALVGPSGCGKTSFLNCLNRMTDLIPGCEVSGRISIGGESVTDPSTDLQRLRRRVGMIFQRPNPFPLSIRQNIQLALREHGTTEQEQLETITQRVLTDVGLWGEVSGRLDGSARDLSGGQAQRLCLARALALEPELLLMDEPCSALDPIASEKVEQHIASLGEHYTVLIVTHNLGQAKRIADETIVFWVSEGAGRIVEQGRTEQIFDSPTEAVTADYVTGRAG
ncbi:MAG: ATP-binding cassette domain-containing protein [Gammaproteobacteria bacterium]|nr:ATP-binding cassette domain-containing protein [Gammaproteobacteria bacterium]